MRQVIEKYPIAAESRSDYGVLRQQLPGFLSN
jgi:hypothetical protein